MRNALTGLLLAGAASAFVLVTPAVAQVAGNPGDLHTPTVYTSEVQAQTHGYSPRLWRAASAAPWRPDCASDWSSRCGAGRRRPVRRGSGLQRQVHFPLRSVPSRVPFVSGAAPAGGAHFLCRLDSAHRARQVFAQLFDGWARSHVSLLDGFPAFRFSLSGLGCSPSPQWAALSVRSRGVSRRTDQGVRHARGEGSAEVESDVSASTRNESPNPRVSVRCCDSHFCGFLITSEEEGRMKGLCSRRPCWPRVVVVSAISACGRKTRAPRGCALKTSALSRTPSRPAFSTGGSSRTPRNACRSPTSRRCRG